MDKQRADSFGTAILTIYWDARERGMQNIAVCLIRPDGHPTLKTLAEKHSGAEYCLPHGLRIQAWNSNKLLAVLQYLGADGQTLQRCSEKLSCCAQGEFVLWTMDRWENGIACGPIPPSPQELAEFKGTEKLG